MCSAPGAGSWWTSDSRAQRSAPCTAAWPVRAAEPHATSAQRQSCHFCQHGPWQVCHSVCLVCESSLTCKALLEDQDAHSMSRHRLPNGPGAGLAAAAALHQPAHPACSWGAMTVNACIDQAFDCSGAHSDRQAKYVQAGAVGQARPAAGVHLAHCAQQGADLCI